MIILLTMKSFNLINKLSAKRLKGIPFCEMNMKPNSD